MTLNKKTFTSLCTPAQVYLVISGMTVLALLFQNFEKPSHYTVGRYSVKLDHHNMIFFVFKVFYVVIWTWLLNKLCTTGYKKISWFLVLLPYLFIFVIIALLLLANM